MAVELAGGLGDVALFALPGLGLTELVPALRRLPLPRRLAYGYLLGIGAVSGGLYGASHVLGVPLRTAAVWCAVALVAAAGLGGFCWRLRRRLRLRRLSPGGAERRGGGAGALAGGERRSGTRRLELALRVAAVLVASVVCAGIFADAVSDPVKDWDGRMTWCTQARYVRAAGTVDAEVLRNPRWFITHPRYPLLLPVAQVAAQEAFGAENDSHAFRALYAAFFPALLLVLYDGARRWAGRAAAALAVLLAALVPFWSVGEGGAISTYSDLPLACFYGAALVVLLAHRGRTGDGLAAGLLLAAAVLSKNEGLPLAAAALVLGALAPGVAWRGWRGWKGWHGATARRRLRRLAVAALPALLALALLLSWRAGIPNREDEDYTGLVGSGDLWSWLVEQPPRFAPVLASRMADWERWRGFWWLVPALLLAGWRVFRRPIAWRLLAAALVPPAVGWAAYSVHRNPTYLATVTWERILMQAAVPLLLLLACALAEALGRTDLQGAPATPREPYGPP